YFQLFIMEEPVSPLKSADHTFKLVALGDAAVGKTACIKRYTEGIFKSDYMATLGSNFSVKMVETQVSSNKVSTSRVVLWDLAGQPSYNELRKRYMAGASLAFIAYDVTRPKSYMNTLEWYHRFHEICPDAAVALIANKTDLDAVVPTSAGKMSASWMDALFYETSAKSGENVDQMFHDLVKQALERKDL
ncbi:MAG: Rab family GTPase, partial [Candidatus Thorarchaeota archaeon]